jgi:ABC-type branched-subunit amino acid transport system substrate-binding protein
MSWFDIKTFSSELERANAVLQDTKSSAADCAVANAFIADECDKLSEAARRNQQQCIVGAGHQFGIKKR